MRPIVPYYLLVHASLVVLRRILRFGVRMDYSIDTVPKGKEEHADHEGQNEP